eukprot:5541739-Alexandrium_andersonii.AAC.1
MLIETSARLAEGTTPSGANRRSDGGGDIGPREPVPASTPTPKMHPAPGSSSPSTATSARGPRRRTRDSA